MKAAIITGAGSGIGKAIALELSKKAYFVYLLGRDKSKLEEVAMLCRSGARRYSCDLTQTQDIDRVTQDILSQQDTDVQVLINNAGIFEGNPFVGSDSKTALDPWRRQFETNLFGSIALTQALLPYFQKQKRGSIVNISSTLGLRPSATTAAYSASKAAMNSWTQSLALEMAGFNIRVNAVCPGLVETPIHGSRDMKSLSSVQPLGRVGQPEEIAKAVEFLANPESSPWTTGVLLPVDGGIQLA